MERKEVSRGAVVASSGAVLLVTLMLTPWALSGGHYSIDEGVLHLMARSWAMGDGVELQTGYARFPSPELLYFIPGRTAHTQVSDGRVVGQYPYLFPLVAAPLVAMLGAKGIVLLNLLGGVLGCALAGSLARQLWNRTSAVWFACLLTLTAGFWLDHSFAIWPHVSATTLFLLALWLLRDPTAEKAATRELGAGLALGCAIGFRLDAIALGVGIAATLALGHRPVPRVLRFVAGLALPLSIQGYVNSIKFGTMNPLSYGVPVDIRTSGTESYLGLAPFVLASAIALWMGIGRSQLARRCQASRGCRYSLMILLALLTVASLPVLADLAFGSYALFIDLASLPDHLAETQRLPSGALLYGRSIKRSFFQSAPHALAGLVFAVMAWRRGDSKTRERIELLVLPVLVLATLYCYRSWHGGAGLNMRYFTPLLPVCAVLFAGLLSERTSALSKRANRRLAALFGAGLFLGGASLYALYTQTRATDTLEFILRQLPLAACLTGLAATLIEGRTTEGVRLERSRFVSALLLLGCVIPSIVLGAGYEFRASVTNRSTHARIGDAVADVIEAPSLLITWTDGPAYRLLETEGVMIACTLSDRGEDLGRLARSASEQNLPVFFLFPDHPTSAYHLNQKLTDWHFERLISVDDLALFRGTTESAKASG